MNTCEYKIDRIADEASGEGTSNHTVAYLICQHCLKVKRVVVDTPPTT